MIYFSSALLIGGGGSALISVRLGENNEKEASKILGNAITMGFFISAVISIFGLLFAKETLLLLGANDEMFSYAMDYYRILLLGIPFMALGFALTFTIRAEGNPRVAVYLMLVSSITNIILDPIFIIGFGMGVKGAAWATFIAEAFAFFLAVRYYVAGKSNLRIRLNDFMPRKALCKQIFLLGLPGCITDMMMGLQSLLMNLQLVKHGGTVAVASMGIIFAVYTMAQMPMFAIADGFQPILGYNYGAGNFTRVRRTVLMVMLMIIGISLLFIVPVVLRPDLFGKIFTSDVEVLAVATKGLRYFMFGLPFFGVYFCGTRYFQSIEKAGLANLLSFCKPFVFFIPVLYISAWAWGLDGIWLSEPVSLFLGSLLVSVLYFYPPSKKPTFLSVGLHNREIYFPLF
jgi:putative MATE family efflux protein